MSEKSFNPISRNEAERKIVRYQKDFSAGMFNDIPASTIPENGIAYLKNFVNKKYELIGRSGSRRWGDYSTNTVSASLPTIATNINYTSIVNTNIRTINIVSGYTFSTENIGDFFVHYNGLNERIINVLSSSQIVTETTDINPIDAVSGSLRKQVNSIYFHKFMKKIVLHIGKDLYVSDNVFMTEWKKAYCESCRTPVNEFSSIDEKDKYILLFNRNGIFKLNLDINEGEDYSYYKINSTIPQTKLEQREQTEDDIYVRRYIYGLGKISGVGQNRNRQTDGVKLLIDSGTNKVIDKTDYIESYSNEEITDVSGHFTIRNLSVPTVDGFNKDQHWDVYTIWGTTDTGVNGKDPITGSANNPEQFIWINDIPIMKCLNINVVGNECTVLDGKITSSDCFSFIKIFNGTYDIDVRIIYVDEENNIFYIDDVGISTLNNVVASIGAHNKAIFTWEQATNSLTVSSGDTITTSDIGKRIFLSNGKTVYIKDVIGNNIFLSNNEFLNTTVYGCWNVDKRNFTDTTTDTILRGRLSDYSCYQRFYDGLPDPNIGLIASGFVLTATRDDNIIYYSQIPDGYEYLAGYYHPTYQISIIKDGIRALKQLNDKLIIYCYNSTNTINLNTYSEINLEDIGVSIATLSSQTTIDDSIGVIAFGSIQTLDNGYHIMITNEPALRIFNGNNFSVNLANNKIMNKLKTFQTDITSIYNPLIGYMFWTLDE